MAYDEDLADRIRDVLGDRDGIRELKMFGGLGFMLHGNMLVGVIKEELMARVGAEGEDGALEQPHARAMDFTGRPMTGFVVVAAEGVTTVNDVRPWVERAEAYVSTLPPK
jgi:TfoX/Sxy family transcriptional regulator of competence genes